MRLVLESFSSSKEYQPGGPCPLSTLPHSPIPSPSPSPKAPSYAFHPTYSFNQQSRAKRRREILSASFASSPSPSCFVTPVASLLLFSPRALGRLGLCHDLTPPPAPPSPPPLPCLNHPSLAWPDLSPSPHRAASSRALLLTTTVIGRISGEWHSLQVSEDLNPAALGPVGLPVTTCCLPIRAG